MVLPWADTAELARRLPDLRSALQRYPLPIRSPAQLLELRGATFAHAERAQGWWREVLVWPPDAATAPAAAGDGCDAARALIGEDGDISNSFGHDAAVCAGAPLAVAAARIAAVGVAASRSTPASPVFASQPHAPPPLWATTASNSSGYLGARDGADQEAPLAALLAGRTAPLPPLVPPSLGLLSRCGRETSPVPPMDGAAGDSGASSHDANDGAAAVAASRHVGRGGGVNAGSTAKRTMGALRLECARRLLLATGSKRELEERLERHDARRGRRLEDAAAGAVPAEEGAGFVAATDASVVDFMRFVAPLPSAAPRGVEGGSRCATVVVDTRERVSHGHRGESPLLALLRRHGCAAEPATLPIGDIVFAMPPAAFENKDDPSAGANPRASLLPPPAVGNSQASAPAAAAALAAHWMLPVVIERKTMDDLAASVISSRFSRQKLFLRDCGAPCIIYLVEGVLSRHGVGDLPTRQQRCDSALLSSAMRDGFAIVRTSSPDESVRFLHTVAKVFGERCARLRPRAGCDPTFGEWMGAVQAAMDEAKTAVAFPRMLCTMRGTTPEAAVEVALAAGSVARLCEVAASRSPEVFLRWVLDAVRSQKPARVAGWATFLHYMLTAERYDAEPGSPEGQSLAV